MTMENNNKYIAEAWIENGKEEEFKKSFLESIINEIQGHGNGFDADTVDGLHISNIREEIAQTASNKITEFYIGNTDFNNFNEVKTYILGFEAIKLYNMENDIIDDAQKILPWETEEENGEDVPSLYEVFESLYNKTKLAYDETEGTPEDENSNAYIYYQLQQTITEMSEILEGHSKALDGRIIDGNLNADCVNGIRFYIYTPEQYNQMKELAETYDPEESDEDSPEYLAYKKINSIHNYFIIKTEDEIKQQYPDGIYPYNPDIAVIDKYYEFAVNIVSRLNEETQMYEEIKMLQYSHSETQEPKVWYDICRASDFLDDEVITQKIIQILSENTNYTIKPEVIRQALELIPIDDNTNIPFATYNKNKYLHGGFYTEDNTNNILETKNDLPQKNGFKFLNLTPLINKINEVKQKALSNEGLINNLNTVISELSQKITQNAQAISSNSSKITEAQSKADDAWSLANIKVSKGIFTWPLYPSQTKYSIWRNSDLCLVTANFRGYSFKHNGNNSHKWEYINITLCEAPLEVVHFSCSKFDVKMKIESDGKVYMKSSSKNTETVELYATVTYFYHYIC